MTSGKATEENRLGEIVDELVEENREGIEKLANEEIAERRRNETIVSKIWREVRRKLGLRKSGAKRMQLQ